MRVKPSEWIILLQVPADILAVFLAFSVAFFWKTSGYIGGLEYVPSFDQYFPFVIVIACFQILVFTSLRFYSFKNRTFLKELGLLIYGTFLWAGVIFALLYLQKQFYFSRLLLLTALIVFFVLAFASRSILRLVRRMMYRSNIGIKGVVIIGSGTQALLTAKNLETLPGWKLLGIIQETDIVKVSWEEIFAQWDGDDKQIRIAEVWNAAENIEQNIEEQLFDFCADRQIVYRYIPTFFTSSAQQVESMFVGDYPLVEVLPTPLRGWGRILKRLVDILGSLVGLLVLSPLFLVIAIIIKVITPGPVFVGLKRVGNKKYKEAFTMYKFRSMIVGAHAMKPQLLALNERKGGPLFKLKNDPRITPVGKYLRKFRIDELPQLWNVLKGQMSLVGPRAHEPEEVAQYTPKQLRLLRVKPGMTGMGQVSGSADISFDEEVKLETYYIQNWSLWLDIQILLRTIWAVINRRGAA